MEFTAIILAGGQSRRFGRDKTLLKIDDNLIVETIASKCKQLFSEVLLVSNHQNKFGIEGVREIGDIYTGQGPLAGIHAGLNLARNNTCFVCACDMPFFYLPLVKELLALSCGYDVVVPREKSNYLQPLFAVYSKTILPQIDKLLSQNENSVLKLYEFAKVLYIDESDWIKLIPENEDVFYNINHAADYERVMLNPK